MTLTGEEATRYYEAKCLFSALSFDPALIEVKFQQTNIGTKIWLECKTTPSTPEFYLDITDYNTW